MQYNPFEILKILDDAEWPNDCNPIKDATKSFDESSSFQLTQLLESDNPIVTRRGLAVFAELGRKGWIIIDDALALSDHPDPMARNALMDGVMSHTRLLSAHQIMPLLRLAADNEELIRAKVITIIALADPDILLQAIQSIAETASREEHLSAYKSSQAPIDDVNSRLDYALTSPLVQSTYAFASIERASRNGSIKKLPCVVLESYVAKHVIANSRRIIAKNKRKRGR